MRLGWSDELDAVNAVTWYGLWFMVMVMVIFMLWVSSWLKAMTCDYGCPP
jgi:uncharacterized membrane protein